MNSDSHSRDVYRRGAWLALAVAIVASGIGLALARGNIGPLLRGYLVSWLFLWGLSLGSWALVMVQHLTGGAWGIVLRRILEAQMRTLPLIALLFLPIAWGAESVYPWAVEAAPEAPAEHAFRAWYLAAPFLWTRAVVFFGLWLLLAWLLSHWSREEDAAGARAAWKCHSLSGPGLVVYGVTLHFAAIDWMMSLESFTSTIYGPVVAAGQLLSALALALVVLACLRKRPDWTAALSGKVLNDLGNLLLTLVLVTTYLVWCQAMLIWMADLRRDNAYWLARSERLWQGVTLVLFFAGFVGPMFALLLRAVKQSVRLLGGLALLLLVVHYLHLVHMIVPTSFFAGTTAWIALLTLCGQGGLWLAAFLWLLASRPLVPLTDRNWQQARHLLHVEQEELAREEALAHG